MSTATVKTAKAANGANRSVRTRDLLSPLNLHWAGVGLLVLVNLYLLAQMGFKWHDSANYNADAMEQQQVTLKTSEIAAQPLRGLDGKLAKATEEANAFSAQRLPATDSEMARELGAMAKKAGVRLTRVAYTPTMMMENSAGELTEVRMDASLSGDYRPLMTFINSLERDKMFFVISGLTLTGQQSGTVNLRLRLRTYLRGGVPPAAEPTAASASPQGGAQ